MGKEFKILYWNIHFKEGSGKEITLRNSSIIINDIINKYDTEIDAIVFTEAYPQLNNKNNKYEKYNTMILDHLKKLGYYVYPYDAPNYNKPEEYPYQDEKKCTNGILIATKHDSEIIGEPKKEPNALGINIKKIGLNLIGVRFFSNIGEEKYIDHIEIISNYLNDAKPNIVIGDFNIDDESLKRYISKSNVKLNVCKTSEYGTNVALYKKDPVTAVFVINNPDKLLFSNCNNPKFELLETPEQIYCKKEYVDDCKLKGNGLINERYGRLNEKICELIIKSFPKQKRAGVKIRKDIDFIKDRYKKFGISFTYNSSNVCITPFPDHNLMLGSVEV